MNNNINQNAGSGVRESVIYDSMGSMKKIRSIPAMPPGLRNQQRSNFDDMTQISNLYTFSADCIPEERHNSRLWSVMLDVIKNSGRLHKMIDNARILKSN